MTELTIDVNTWPRAGQFELFRTYQNPHYSVTSRIDVTSLMGNTNRQDVSSYRASLYAIAAGIHAVPELMTRFRQNEVVQHDSVSLSMTVPRDDGAYGYAYVPFQDDFAAFDADCSGIIEAVSRAGKLEANTGQRDDLVYLSCLPWFDFTSFSNALPGPEDCIPRVIWGKFIDHGGRWDMALSIEVHHALVDGAHLGIFFDQVQTALNEL